MTAVLKKAWVYTAISEKGEMLMEMVEFKTKSSSAAAKAEALRKGQRLGGRGASLQEIEFEPSAANGELEKLANGYRVLQNVTL
jgi:hypothetical protein